MENKSYIITGPTASGKSDFAHQLAKKIGGVIINADSVQLYRGIENLSASPLVAPSVAEVPYKLYSIAEPTKPLSAGIWAKMARAEYDAALAAGKTPIFVGGAGFYLRALLQGFSPIPEISPENRAKAREIIKNKLPITYHLSPITYSDPQRQARALEVFLETGKTLEEWHKLPLEPVLPERPFSVLILPPKDIVRQRIADRMPVLAKSVLDEVRAVMDLSPDLPITRADGVREMAEYIRGETDFDTAMTNWRRKIESGTMKRQYTWFRTQFAPDLIIDHIPTEQDLKNF